MKSKLINLIICLSLGSSTAIFAQGKIDLSGVFFDGLTGKELPTKVIAHIKDQSYEVASTDTSNTFNFQLTTDIEEIEFQAEGYKTVKLPVIFHGEFAKHSKAEISIQTFNKKPRFRTEDLIIFCYPQDYAEYKVYDWHVLDSTGYSIRFKFGSSYKIDSNSISLKRSRELSPLGKLEISDSLSRLDSRIHKTAAGLNFVDTNTYYECNDSPNSQNAQNLDSLRKLIWLKDSEISEQGKSDLEYVLNYLDVKPNSKIALNGLFDTNGIYETNLSSPIFNAKTVGNYLKNNGVTDDRILIFWEYKKNNPPFGETIVPHEFANLLPVEVLVLSK